MASSSFLVRTTRQFAVGVLIQENQSDIHGQVTPTTSTPSPFHQMDRSLRARRTVKLFVSGTQLLVVPSDNLYDMRNVYIQFVFLPLVNLLASARWDGKIYIVAGTSVGQSGNYVHRVSLDTRTHHSTDAPSLPPREQPIRHASSTAIILNTLSWH